MEARVKRSGKYRLISMTRPERPALDVSEGHDAGRYRDAREYTTSKFQYAPVKLKKK